MPAKFINAKNNEIIFTKSTTESINLVAYSLGLNFFKKNDEILITEMEHHSNIVPWQMISKKFNLVLNKEKRRTNEHGVDGRRGRTAEKVSRGIRAQKMGLCRE